MEKKKGKILHNKRNLVKKVKTNKRKLVVKSFGRIVLINKFAYSWLRDSKAKRAYDNAMLFLSLGINTPKPVAYVECFRFGLLVNSYFIAKYTKFEPISEVIYLSQEQQDEFVRDIAVFATKLHKHDIYHVDFNIENVLFKYKNGKFIFSLIDNNRMVRTKMPLTLGVKNFSRLHFPAPLLEKMVKEYIKINKGDEAILWPLSEKYRRDFLNKDGLWRKIKRLWRKPYTEVKK